MLREPGWSGGSLSRKSLVKERLRTNSGTFAGVLHLVQRSYWIEEYFGGGGDGCWNERAVPASR